MRPRLSRRRLFVGLGLAAPLAGAFLGACGAPPPTPTPTEPPSPTPLPPTATAVPSPTLVPATPTPIPKGMLSPDYSIQVFLWGSASAQRDLGLVKELGFRWIKQGIEWRYIEPHQKGVYEWNEPDRLLKMIGDLDLQVIARVDNQPVWARSDKVFPADGPPDKLQDFADFLNAVAKRYKGQIQAYEIWNEPNLAREWGGKAPSSKDYVALLKVAYEAVKAADPDATVISAGLAPTTAGAPVAMPDVEFVKGMYQAGGAKYFDMLGVHGAGYKAPPDMSPDAVGDDPTYNHGEKGAGRIYCFRHVEDVRQVMVDNGDAAKRVAVLEFGWTTDPRPDSPYKWHAVTEQQQADYLVGAYAWAKAHWQPWIGAMSAIYIAAPYWTPNDEEYYWSITLPDGTPRQAYRALAQMKK